MEFELTINQLKYGENRDFVLELTLPACSEFLITDSERSVELVEASLVATLVNPSIVPSSK